MSTEGAVRPTARRLVLGSQLRRLREAKEISRNEAGFEIRSSGSKISRIELGRVGVKKRDIFDLLTMYGVTDEEQRRRFDQLIDEANQPGWWNRYNDFMPGWLQDYVGLEEATIRLQTYEFHFVPGLLQVEPYARALAQRSPHDLRADEMERRVQLRIGRQKLLQASNAPTFWAVMDESVLNRPIGGKTVLIEQIKHLIEMSKRPNVSLQVLPFSAGASPAESAFTMMRFGEPEIPDVVFVEHLTGAAYLDKAADVELYARVSHRLAVDAWTPDETRRKMVEVLDTLQSH